MSKLKKLKRPLIFAAILGAIGAVISFGLRAAGST
jgi:hypothetical protein